MFRLPYVCLGPIEVGRQYPLEVELGKGVNGHVGDGY